MKFFGENGKAGDLNLGTSIKNVFSEGEGGRVQKMTFWGNFKGLTGQARKMRVVKNNKKYGNVFYG